MEQTATTTDMCYRAVLALTMRDDGARRRDDVGFNAADSDYGNRLALTLPRDWNERTTRRAHKMLAKYRKQLADLGIDYDAIPTPPGPERKAILTDGDIGLYFEYDERVLAAVKTIPGRRFQNLGDVKYWTAPRASAAYVTALADSHGFDIDPAIQALADALPADAAVAEPPAPREPTVELSADGSTLVFQFDYNADIVAAVKEIPGRRWDGEHKRWSVPVNGSTAHLISDVIHAYGFPTTAALAERLGGQIQRDHEAIAASRGVDADFHVDGLGGTLRPFQRAGVAYGHRALRLFIADEPGLGKTCQSLAIAHASRAYPILIICPASLKLNWAREAHTWLPEATVQVIDATTPIGVAAITIINYDIVNRRLEELKQHAWQALICDEAHYLKGHKTQRTKAVQALVKAQPMPVRLLLSGTPILNKPPEILAQLQILGRLDDLGGWRYFATRYGGYDGAMMGARRVEPATLQELNTRMRATCFIRRLKADVLKELPPKQRVMVPLALDNRADYAKAEADIIAYVRDRAESDAEFLESIAHLNDLDRELAVTEHGEKAARRARYAEMLVKLNALRQLAAHGKLLGAGEWITNFLESGEKLILFGWHNDVLTTLADVYKAPLINGATPLARRQEYVDRFQNDPACKLILLNIQAGGVGLTLTAASNVAFIELPWRPGDLDQCEDRAHRIGQANSVTAWYLVAENTIDETMAHVIEAKRAVVDAVTDGASSTQRIGGGSVIGDVVAHYRKGKSS